MACNVMSYLSVAIQLVTLITLIKTDEDFYLIHDNCSILQSIDHINILMYGLWGCLLLQGDIHI